MTTACAPDPVYLARTTTMSDSSPLPANAPAASSSPNRWGSRRNGDDDAARGSAYRRLKPAERSQFTEAACGRPLYEKGRQHG
jgi:hypothetical protein